MAKMHRVYVMRAIAATLHWIWPPRFQSWPTGRCRQFHVGSPQIKHGSCQPASISEAQLVVETMPFCFCLLDWGCAPGK